MVLTSGGGGVCSLKIAVRSQFIQFLNASLHFCVNHLGVVIKVKNLKK